jgi:hypothetical protein
VEGKGKPGIARCIQELELGDEKWLVVGVGRLVKRKCRSPIGCGQRKNRGRVLVSIRPCWVRSGIELVVLGCVVVARVSYLQQEG